MRIWKKDEHAILAQYISQRLYHFGVQAFFKFHLSLDLASVWPITPTDLLSVNFGPGMLVVGMNAGAPPCLLPKALARQAIRYHHPSRANATRRPTVVNASLTRSLSKKCNIKIPTSIVGPSAGGWPAKQKCLTSLHGCLSRRLTHGQCILKTYHKIEAGCHTCTLPMCTCVALTHCQITLHNYTSVAVQWIYGTCQYYCIEDHQGQN